jgi:hypothetical protein
MAVADAASGFASSGEKSLPGSLLLEPLTNAGPRIALADRSRGVSYGCAFPMVA